MVTPGSRGDTNGKAHVDKAVGGSENYFDDTASRTATKRIYQLRRSDWYSNIPLELSGNKAFHRSNARLFDVHPDDRSE